MNKLSLISTIILSASIGTSALDGNVILSAGSGIYAGKLSNMSGLRVMSGTSGLYHPIFSNDGKLIAALDGTTVAALFSDGTGRTVVAAGLQFDHVESNTIAWVKTRDGSYEIAYPQTRGIESVALNVNHTTKKINAGAVKTLARQIGLSTAKKGMNGAFDIVDASDGSRRLLVRARHQAEFHTLPNKETAAIGSGQYSWPAMNDGHFYDSPIDAAVYPHSCYHNICRDGAYAQLMENIWSRETSPAESDFYYEWPFQKGDHLGFILVPWQKPAKAGLAGATNPKPTAKLPYVLYNTPSSISGEVRCYHWTNDPRIVTASDGVARKLFLIELAEYPPKIIDAKHSGAATWKQYTSPVSGLNRWDVFTDQVSGSASPRPANPAMSNSVLQKQDRVVIQGPRANGIVTVCNARGVKLGEIALRNGNGVFKPRCPGLYIAENCGTFAACIFPVEQ